MQNNKTDNYAVTVSHQSIKLTRYVTIVKLFLRKNPMREANKTPVDNNSNNHKIKKKSVDNNNTTTTMHTAKNS